MALKELPFDSDAANFHMCQFQKQEFVMSM